MKMIKLKINETNHEDKHSSNPLNITYTLEQEAY